MTALRLVLAVPFFYFWSVGGVMVPPAVMQGCPAGAEQRGQVIVSVLIGPGPLGWWCYATVLVRRLVLM